MAPPDWGVLGLVHAELGELEAAELALRAGLQQPVEHEELRAALLGNLGIVLRKQERFAEAEECLRRSFALIGDHHPIADALYLLLGKALLGQERRDEAINALKRAVELGRDNEEAHYALAMALPSDQGAERITLLREALRLNPEFAPAREQLGVEESGGK